jgi:hypothetical protein
MSAEEMQTQNPVLHCRSQKPFKMMAFEVMAFESI